MCITGLLHQPMKVHISKDTADLLQDTDFIVEERGKVEMKVRRCNMPL